MGRWLTSVQPLECTEADDGRRAARNDRRSEGHPQVGARRQGGEDPEPDERRDRYPVPLPGKRPHDSTDDDGDHGDAYQ